MPDQAPHRRHVDPRGIQVRGTSLLHVVPTNHTTNLPLPVRSLPGAYGLPWDHLKELPVFPTPLSQLFNFPVSSLAHHSIGHQRLVLLQRSWSPCLQLLLGLAQGDSHRLKPLRCLRALPLGHPFTLCSQRPNSGLKTLILVDDRIQDAIRSPPLPEGQTSL